MLGFLGEEPANPAILQEVQTAMFTGVLSCNQFHQPKTAIKYIPNILEISLTDAL